MLGKKQIGKTTTVEDREDKYEAMKINIRDALHGYHDYKAKGVSTKKQTQLFLSGFNKETRTIIKDILDNPEKETMYADFLTHDVSKIPKFEEIKKKNEFMKGILDHFKLPTFGVKPIVTINRDKLVDEIDVDLFDDGSSGMNEIQKIKLSEILDEINDPTRDGILDEALGINADFLKTYNFLIEIGDGDFLFMIPPDYIDIHARLDEMASSCKHATSIVDIPIYFVISNPYTPHLTTIILYKSNFYSFGYGYSGPPSEEKDQKFNEHTRVADKHKLGIALQHYEQASIYTPDYLIFENFKIRHQDDKVYDVQKRTRGNIVDMGILDKKFCLKLKQTLSKITKVKLFIRCNKEKVGTTKHMKSCGVTHLSIDVDETYSQLSNNYCTDNYRNCTSFVTQLFPHINCNLFQIPLLVHPHFCYKTRGVDIDKNIMESLYKIYRKKRDDPALMIDFMKKIAGDLSSPGSKGKTKKQKIKHNKSTKK